MKKDIASKVYSAATILELVISLLLIVVIVIMGIRLAGEILSADTYRSGEDVLSSLLGKALSLAVGVEFIKMLCKHTPSTVIEVLMFATARQMVVEHLSSIQTLIGVLSIAVLFATRKYLFYSMDEIEKNSLD